MSVIPTDNTHAVVVDDKNNVINVKQVDNVIVVGDNRRSGGSPEICVYVNGVRAANTHDLEFDGPVSYSLEDGKLKLSVHEPKQSPTLALHFAGFYDDIQSLNDAIPNPSSDLQAIVIKPSDKYYHAVGGSWVALAPVGSIHTGYVGSYDNTQDLESAEPNAPKESVAIVGTSASRDWYIKEDGGWVALKSSTVPALTARMDTAEQHLQTLQQQDIAMSDDIDQLKRDQFTGISITDEDGNSFDDIKGFKIIGGYASDDDGNYIVDLNISPKVDVSNGQDPSSVSESVKALEFPGAHITVRDPDGANVGVITIPKANIPDSSVSVIVDGATYANKSKLEFVDFTAENVSGDPSRIKLTAPKQSYSGSGIHIDNGTSDLSGVEKLNFPTSEFIARSTKEVDIIPYVRIAEGDNTAQNAEAISLLPPLKVQQKQGNQYIQELYVDARAYEEQHAASCLLQLDSDVTLNSGRETKLYTSHEIIPTGEYYSLNQQAGGVNVQDNTGGDTAATGGELTRVMGSVSFYGKATDNSNVKLWFEYKDPASPLPASILKDVNGNPMIVERYYNQGDELSVPLLISGAMMATGQAPIVLKVEVSAGSYVVNPDQTLICIEQFSDGYETSLASIEFQRRLGVELHAEIKHFKTTELSLKSEILGSSQSEGVIQPLQGYDFLNEFGVQNLTEVKASISDDTLNISDNGKIADYYVDVYLDNIKTSMLRGKDVDYDVTIKNPNDAYRLEVYKWNGKADSAGRIYDSRSDGSLVLNDGFVLVKSKFIAEQPDGQFRGYTDSVTVPSDANNLFIIIRPAEAQSPSALSISEFTWGVPTPIIGYKETSRVNLHEMHLKYSENWAEFGLNNQGYASLRYTINNTPSTGNPMPVGKLLKGKAPVEIDNTVNQVAGSSDPKNDGAIKFLKDGEASISKSYNLWNETGTDNTVTFWDVLIGIDGQEDVIADSRRTFTVPANTSGAGVVYTIPAYTTIIETGQLIAGRATSNKADGAFVQSKNISEYIVQTEIDFKEVVTDYYDDPELVSVPIPRASLFDRRVYSFNDNALQNIVIDLDIPSDVELAEIEVVKHSGTVTTSINDCEYAYDSATKKLTIHVGNGVTYGKVYLTFWSGVS